MNTFAYRRRSFALKVLSVIAVAFICISFFTQTVRADSGPKRSIKISLKNLPTEPYYIAILDPGSRPSDPDNYYNYVKVAEEDKEIKDIFFNYEEDGFALYCEPSGRCSIVPSESIISDSIDYGYYVPSTFKVIVVTKSCDVTVSNEITTKAFYSDCEYDYSTNTLKEVNVGWNIGAKLATESIPFFYLTLFIEGIVLLCFGLFKEKNVRRFLLANTITQLLLFVFNFTCSYIEPLLKHNVLAWLGVEVLITVIELFIYRKSLTKKEGNVSIKRNIAYAITANVISAFIDIPFVIIGIMLGSIFY
ncbi:MAG: hypothetical protein K6F45_07600 [Saccharofermentans sp.]|nr:hypothetical protein [Saccharofermentans sp.]